MFCAQHTLFLSRLQANVREYAETKDPGIADGNEFDLFDTYDE